MAAENPVPAEGLTFLVCGGGNGAHAFAGVAAHRGAKVNVFTPFQDEVDKWSGGSLSITCHYAADGTSTTAKPTLVTTDPKEAAAGVDIAIVVLPSFCHDKTLADVGPHLPEGSAIGTIEGAWWGRPPIEGGVLDKLTFFGVRTLPWAARIKEYGSSVDILGTKSAVEVASSPNGKAAELSGILERIVGIKFPPCANLLGLFALDASGIIHPGVMYGRLSDWDGETFDEAPLFYQGIDPKTAEVMQAMDAEVITLKDKICSLYPDLDLSDVVPTLKWLQDSYGDQIADKSTFQSSFNTNASYVGLKFPMKEAPGAPGKLVPLFDYRYLTADVPHGIVVIKGIAELVGHPTPEIDKVIAWAQKHLGKEWIVGDKLAGKDLGETRAPQKFGITTVEELMKGVAA
mmetsp:Transcript_52847/g.146460  ORF Transcript_52847/g.146460 Transcript_52847/m.146460 type:complete len:402 (-) Transcript_52847:176-1381(-)